MIKIIALAGLLAVFVSCTQGLDTKSLSIFIPALYPEPMAVEMKGPYSPMAAPAQGDFDCIRVNIVGRGIPDFYDAKKDTGPQADQVAAGSSCTYPGVISKALPVTTSSTITMDVLTGANRVIQVAGVEDTGSTYSFCGTGPLQFCDGNTSATCVNPKIYELGRAKLGISSGMSVAIQNTYKDLTDETARGNRLMNCGPKDGGGATDPNNFINFIGIYGSSTVGGNFNKISIYKHLPGSTLPEPAPMPTPSSTYSNVKDLKVSPDEQTILALDSVTLRGIPIYGNGDIGDAFDFSTSISGVNKIAVSNSCVAVFGGVSAVNNFSVIPYKNVNGTVSFGTGTSGNVTTAGVLNYGLFSGGGQYFYIFSRSSGSPPYSWVIQAYAVDASCNMTQIGGELQIDSSSASTFVKVWALIYENGRKIVAFARDGSSGSHGNMINIADTGGVSLVSGAYIPPLTVVQGDVSKSNNSIFGLANSEDQIIMANPTSTGFNQDITSTFTNSSGLDQPLPKFDGLAVSSNSQWVYLASPGGAIIRVFYPDKSQRKFIPQKVDTPFRDAVVPDFKAYGGMFTYKRQK